MKSLINDIRRTAAAYSRGLKFCLTASPSYFLCLFLQETLNAISPFVALWFSAQLLDELVGSREPSALLTLALGLILSEFAFSALTDYLEMKSNLMSFQFSHAERHQFTEKIMGLDYEDIEDPKVHALYQKVRNASNSGCHYNLQAIRLQIPDLYDQLLTLVIALFTLAGFIKCASLPWWCWALLAASLALCAILSVKSIAKSEQIDQEYMKSIVPFTSHRDELTEYLEDYVSGKNLRIFNAQGLFIQDLADWHHKIDLAVDKCRYSQVRVMAVFTYLPMAVSEAITQGVLIMAAFLGRITVGNIARYAACIQKAFYSLQEIGSILTAMKYNTDYLEEYFSFLDLPERMKKGALPVEKRHDHEYQIRFDHVSFRYPGAEDYALRDITLSFRIGEKMAIVGENGSGKTTFIKLLCRLYDPTEGTIYLNNIDIRKYNYREYLELFSVVFQDFALFSFSLGENVAAAVDYDRELAKNALIRAGLGDFLEKLPRGLDTPLYKNFDPEGMEISGGEAQKTALARAIYKEAPFVVLDEPTAALDPLAEYEIYSRFQEIVEDRTTVFISHRLSSCRFCQDIAVFHQGRLVQRGSHEELIADRDGKYRELWNAQAQYYTN